MADTDCSAALRDPGPAGPRGGAGVSAVRIASLMIDEPPVGFVRAYHLTLLDHAKADIQHDRLKVATFADANDPFELLALNCRGRSKRAARKVIERFKESQGERIGLLCFSRFWRNPVLWSHYAGGHKGVCLGFDVKADALEEVKYADERLTAELDGEQEPLSIPDGLQDLLFVTKFRHWEYEDEVRRFVLLSEAEQEGELYFWPFDEDMRLREVILGPLCPRSELETVRALVAESKSRALVSRARLGFSSFEVRPDGRYPPS